jgi:hypothetical protein
MAYTVKVHGTHGEACDARDRIVKLVNEDGRFAIHQPGPVDVYGFGSREGSRKNGYGFTLMRVRLTEPKPYCGQHPGECAVGTKKKNMTYLEWDDWVAFHALVNRALLGIDADVWSMPLDIKGYMWLRKGRRVRVRYDYDEKFNTMGRAVRTWNPGTDDQFINEEDLLKAMKPKKRAEYKGLAKTKAREEVH